MAVAAVEARVTTAAMAPPAESHRKVSRNSWLMYPTMNLVTVRVRVRADSRLPWAEHEPAREGQCQLVSASSSARRAAQRQLARWRQLWAVPASSGQCPSSGQCASHDGTATARGWRGPQARGNNGHGTRPSGVEGARREGSAAATAERAAQSKARPQCARADHVSPPCAPDDSKEYNQGLEQALIVLLPLEVLPAGGQRS